MRTININLAQNGYPVNIGPLSGIGAAFVDAGFCGRAAVISDDNVWPLHGDIFISILRGAGIDPHPVIIPAGEASKSLNMLAHLYSRFHAMGLKRGEPVITFGGGVVGDLGGFAAATYMRGVPFVQVPTTLLAQVDASVGGKVAIDLPEGKNLAGAFYQPCFVHIDTVLLTTLPLRQRLSGMAEVIKHAAIHDLELLSALESGNSLSNIMDDIIYMNVRCKARYVENDERDTGERMQLNFGHTFGHAIEKYHNFEGITHGEAVAIGMVLAAQAGTAMGITPPHVQERLCALMSRHGLETRLDCGIKDIIPLMAGDKKNIGDSVTLILLKAFGEAVAHRVTLGELSEVMGV